MDQKHIYRFADFVLDAPNRRLTRRDAEVYLPPKTFDTLLVLVQRQGQLVTKRALLDEVWNDTAVTDNALTQQISELRETLGDSARHPRFIRTLPRVGFTFIAPVEIDDAAGRPTDLRPVNAFHKSTLVALAVVVVVAVGWVWLAARSGNRLDRLELVSNLPGLHRSPTFSPDNRTVGFISDRSGTPQLWVRALAGGDPVQLTFHDRPVARPRWSLKGDRIVYSVEGNGIWSVAPLGGSPRQLVETGWNADLSPDGRALVFERSWEIWTANADGTNQRRLPTLKQGYLSYYGDAWPTFSPDGKQIAFFLGERGSNGDYWLAPAAGGEPRRLTFDAAEGGAPAWTPDGKHIVVSSARTGSVTLWRIPVGGGAPEALTTGSGDDLDPAISSDGRRVLFINVKRTWALVIHNTRNGSRRTVFETITPLACPRFSWDGRFVAFFGKNEAGDTHVFVRDAATGRVRAVTTGRGELNIMPQWAFDNRSIFYYQVSPRSAFRRISVAGGTSEEIARWQWDREHQASADPSSARIAYSVLEHGRLRETRVRRLDNSQETTLAAAVFDAQFSRDGRLVAGESQDAQVMVCEVTGACRAITPKLEHGLASIGWSADGTQIFYLERTDTAGWGELKSVSVDGRAERSYGAFGPLRTYNMCIGVSPQDEIVFAPYQEGRQELWTAQLR